MSVPQNQIEIEREWKRIKAQLEEHETKIQKLEKRIAELEHTGKRWGRTEHKGRPVEQDV
jgi:prefoldin subunit 5